MTHRMVRPSGPNATPDGIVPAIDRLVHTEKTPNRVQDETTIKKGKTFLQKTFGFKSKKDLISQELDELAKKEKDLESIESDPDRRAYLAWLQIEREKARKELYMNDNLNSETTTELTPKARATNRSRVVADDVPPAPTADPAGSPRRRGRRRAPQVSGMEKSPSESHMGESQHSHSRSKLVSPKRDNSSHLRGGVELSPNTDSFSRRQQRTILNSRRQLKSLDLTEGDEKVVDAEEDVEESTEKNGGHNGRQERRPRKATGYSNRRLTKNAEQHFEEETAKDSCEQNESSTALEAEVKSPKNERRQRRPSGNLSRRLMDDVKQQLDKDQSEASGSSGGVEQAVENKSPKHRRRASGNLSKRLLKSVEQQTGKEEINKDPSESSGNSGTIEQAESKTPRLRRMASGNFKKKLMDSVEQPVDEDGRKKDPSECGNSGAIEQAESRSPRLRRRASGNLNKKLLKSAEQHLEEEGSNKDPSESNGNMGASDQGGNKSSKHGRRASGNLSKKLMKSVEQQEEDESSKDQNDGFEEQIGESNEGAEEPNGSARNLDIPSKHERRQRRGSGNLSRRLMRSVELMDEEITEEEASNKRTTTTVTASPRRRLQTRKTKGKLCAPTPKSVGEEDDVE